MKRRDSLPRHQIRTPELPEWGDDILAAVHRPEAEGTSHVRCRFSGDRRERAVAGDSVHVQTSDRDGKNRDDVI